MSLKYVKILLIILFIIDIKYKKIKIGIFGCRNDINIGNFLIKFAMHIILTELGFEPYIVATNKINANVSFLKSTTNLVEIQNFSSIDETQYEILIVNSDQTWRKWDEFFYDYGFLKFA